MEQAEPLLHRAGRGAERDGRATAAQGGLVGARGSGAPAGRGEREARRHGAQAVALQDLPVVQALVLLGSAVFAVANLLVDLLYPVIDPRLARTRAGRAR
ncbi:hypothetical protein [Streptomyces sp. NRRL F-5123]|uniref:hypothetical protein n=1 Tax=Streptomyces sp. NRRL F-5123 TaxID=1463856 RepID=UPI0005B9362E|nr:hypothetical protein [Streptomyces sp. NRRL F-5123]